MGKERTKGAQGVDTPKKAQISRDYQPAGGSQIRGAAAAVARKHGLNPTSGPGRVKKWDAEIRDGVASRANRRSSGRPKGLSPEVKQNIEDVFREDDTQTYREAAEKLGLPASTLHDYATKDLDYRCLNQTVRPYPSEANRDKRITISQGIVGTPATRVKLQIDSAGGHGTARGHGNFDDLAAMMDTDYNIELVQQPGNSPMFNVLDLTIWRTTQVLVDKMSTEARQREADLVKTVKKAWTQLPGIKILEAFEWRRDVAQEALDTEGWCPMEGKGKGGSKRVHEDNAYAALRT